jgi:DNA-binding MarR family transcriptional regulator
VAAPTEPTQPAGDPAQPWAHRLGHLLWETAARVSLIGEAELADTPLTLPSLGLLDIIEATPGITVAEISRRLPTTQQSISQTIARLEKLGYVQRRLGPRRGVGLHITQAGQQAHHEGTARGKALDQRLEDLLGAERHRDLCGRLEQARELLVSEDRRTDAATTKVPRTP